MKNILIIEDDKTICNELKNILENNNYKVSFINDFNNTINEINNINPDLILLDINLPILNGEGILKELRKTSNIPVIMVTSKNNDIDEVLSMSYGADDYITKPYNPTILILRIEAIFKRIDNNYKILKYRDLELIPSKSILKNNNIEINLTKNEMIILTLLIEKQGIIVTKDELMTNLWDNSEYINENALTVNISRLRSKLESFGYKDTIITRKGQGYILS